MAFKYKLPQRQSGLTPEKLQAMGAEVDLEARKEFVTTPANTDKSEELEKLIIYSLEEASFSPEDIDNYLEFLYIERNNNIGGEFGDVPLNEKISNIVKKVLTEEEKKKADRCLRIARRKFKKSSAYRSGAIVRCRQGKIWKGLKEYEDLTAKNSYIDIDGNLDFEHVQNDLIKIKPYYKSLLPNYLNDEPLTDDQIDQLIELFTDNEADIFDANWMTDADKLKFNQRWRKADINDLSDWFVSFVEGLADNWEEYPLNEDKPQSGKAAPYGSGYSKVKEIIENILKEDESLRKWFKRRGTPGKEGGWVDCNTCRNGKCKSCGRKKGEKRAKYPSCRPTPAQCKTRGKGKKWGKTK